MSRAPSVLLVGLRDPYRAAFEDWARRSGIACFALEGDVVGLARPADCGLCVIGFEAGSGRCVEKIRTVRKSLHTCPIVVLAEGIGTDEVVRVMRAGAADVIGLPAAAEDVAARALLHLEGPGSELSDEALVGHSAVMQQLRRDMEAVAPVHSTVLLTGETGVGKGLVAREIHRISGRSGLPFVHVDCAALAPTVIESELFGHERGSFTGAVGRHPGRFALAGTGTIFLDEIGDLEPGLQAKLLRVLQDRQYERIGGRETLSMNARVIAATNRDIRQAVDEGAFRADLFFRLAVFHIEVPPLRDRLDDIPALTRAGVEALSSRLQVAPAAISDGFYERLRKHAWPGNVRELENALERLVVRNPGGELDEFAADALLEERLRKVPGTPRSAAHAVDGDEVSGREAIADALDAAGGNVARVARRLGIPRSTLRYRIQKLGLDALIPHD
ncbi:MAG: sigma-54 dependent transcriptional regulator [Myxococcota bacterium]|nr:sigma-54 dependent transcriptional regulator [Myxococcota bacterium]